MRTSFIHRLRRRAWQSAGSGGFALALLFGAEPAHAQRGEHQALREPLRVASPDDGFPGLFDTQLAAKGSVVGNFPAASLYVGVTSDLTVGTSLWSYVPLASGLPSGSLHARYRLGSTPWFRTTLDVLGFGMLERQEDRSRAPWTLGLLGSNTEFVLSDAHRLTLSGWLGHTAGQTAPGVDTSASVALLGGTYSLVFARWGALRLTGLYLMSTTGAVDSSGASLDVNLTNGMSASDRWLARGMFDFRAGNWLFGVGAARAGSVILPWLNVGFRIGG
jgi:hypothetical protein